jgi:mannose-6-phosphate isomerase-like protein (cupin superfamily)
MPVIGFFHLTSLETNRENLAAFRRGLGDLGYIEGKNVAIEYRWAQGQNDHVHFKQEEILFIIEGLYEVTVGDETAKAGPGSIVFIPRNVVHRFKNVGGITGRMLGWSLPGGQDHYLKAISELAAGGGFTSEQVMEISRTFDTHFPVEP